MFLPILPNEQAEKKREEDEAYDFLFLQREHEAGPDLSPGTGALHGFRRGRTWSEWYLPRIF